ncbi:AI-2E family transporter [Colwellia sp. 1_MG-2023]|jgi:predicted PurR-regulated permease PerM|uniref:AI-2E family transporter n=1 Tax=unclassified Colwellia TaxID=196834 RepID=UPI001C08967D|nr:MULTISPECIES: AI-2E family transporter [unclassified Colwellia]MBU2926498.1 AI-2E family transporter [Colwellia sp. C2M11]MDO6487457.1 AI-2E family transporter [Colwellia sp. 6_MG-2023]MDO6652536.1 AI-2E family transporter [Colwellia sp. 3_MG-2023]MDO6665137.1 AI-2E family transporter [Colwellia sp. 2_MG-2023]MDO6689541.1 AI-2E family transporter [Colwellia sp. 1_MG-2023]
MVLSTKNSSMVKGFVTVAAIFIIFAGVKTAANILVPFLLSLFIAIICNPLVVKASQFKIPKAVSVIIVIAIFVTIALSLAGLVGKSLNELSELIPQYRLQFQEQFTWLTAFLSRYNIQISSSILLEYFDPAAAMGMAANMLSGFGSVMANLLLIVLTVVFMLFEASSFPVKLHFALDDPEMRIKQIERFLASVNHYIAIKTMVSIATGMVVSLMLWAFGLDFYLLWGVFAFLLNYIPNIGSIIAAVPAVTLASLQLGIGEAGFIGLGYVAINMVMGNMIEPRYLGKGLGLSTLVVFLSLIFWGWLLGTVGMLLSVPLTMILKIGLESTPEGRWLAVLLSDEDSVLLEIEQIQKSKD